MRLTLVLFLLAITSPVVTGADEQQRPTVESVKRTIKEQPTDIGAWYLLARSYLGLVELPNEDSSGINQHLQNSGAFYEDALQRLERGEQAAAIIQLKNAINADEKNLSAYILLAEIYSEARAPRMAEQYLRSVLSQGADPGLVMEPLAEALIAGEQYEALIADLPLTGRSPELRARLQAYHARAYVGLRQFDKAAELLADALDEDGTLVPVRLESARLAIIRGETSIAGEHLDFINDSGEYVPDYWLLRGELARLEMNFDRALEHYNHAIRLKSDHRLALGAAADLLLQQGNLAGALELVTKIRSWYPEDLRALLLQLTIARLQEDFAQFDAAVIEANNVIRQLDYGKLQEDPYGLFVVGSIQSLADHPSEAAALFAQYLELVPDDLNGLRLLVDAQLRLQRAETALRSLNTAARFHADLPEFKSLLADVYIAQKDYSSALPLLDELSAAWPDNRGVRLKRARVNANLNDYGTALRDLEQLRRTGADPAVNATLVDLLLALGEFNRVIELAAEPDFGVPPAADIARGKALIGQGDLAQARVAFDRALATAPDSTVAAFNIAVIYRQSGDVARAEKELKAVLARDRSHRQSMLALASIAESRGDRMESARYLADALKVKSEVADHIRLINLLSQDKREQDARDALSELKLQHPSNLKVMALDAVFNRQSDNVDRARQIYNNMRDQAIAEGSVQALIQIARDQYEIGQKADAQLSLAQAQALDPNTLAITIVQTEIFLAEGAYEQALELAEQLVSRAPHQPIGYRLKGDALRDMNRSGPALEAYLDGLEKSGTTLELVLNAYLLKRQQTGLDDAVSFLEDLVRRQPAANYVILRALAAGYADVGKTVQAIALNESLLENQPNDPVVLNNLALVYFESGDQRARDFAQKAYDLAPENYAIMDTLGWILVNRGETGLGVTILRNALARSANIPEIRYHYAVALHRNGQSKAAERELLALLRSGVDFENMDAARSLYQEITGNTN